MTDKTKEGIAKVLNECDWVHRAKALAKICAIVDEERKPIPTAELIAELEKRRPTDCANRCEYIGSEVCGACIWGLFIGEEPGGIKDNFNLSK